MKKVIKKSLVIAVMLSAMVSYANDFVYAYKEKGKVTNVSFKNVAEGSVLTIKDSNGLILYKETIERKGDYSKQFDLTALPNGNYLFELNKESEIRVIPFSLNLDKVVFDKTTESIIFKPAIIEKNGIVKIHNLIFNNKPLKINVYFENNDLVYTKVIENKQILRKVFNFTTSLKGKYKIVLSTEGRTFEKDFKI